jgi:cytochrome d ubiquinol oxidase subunit II
VYANLFSRNYLLLFGVLAALILRGLAPEMYEQRHDAAWQRWWGRSFVVGSVLTPFLLGVFTANWLTGSGALLTPVGVAVGSTLVALTVVSGAAFLRVKTAGSLREGVRRAGERALVAYLGLVVVTLGLLSLSTPRLAAAVTAPAVLALVATSVGLGVGYVAALRTGRDLLALVASGLLTYGLVAVVAFLLFPLVDPGTGLSVSEAIVAPLALNIMSVASAFLLPLVVTYFVVLYSAFSGPVRPTESY